MTLEYHIARPPDFGTTIEIAPDILWLRMPLPFALDHVNLWLLNGPDGWSLIDTGIADDRSRALWEGVLAGPLSGQPIHRLVVSHFHPDHVGLASWLAERFGLLIDIPLAEWSFGRMLTLDQGDALPAATQAFYQAAGFDDALMDMVRKRGNSFRTRTPSLPVQFRRLKDGGNIDLGGRRFATMVGEGHSPEQMTFFDADGKILVSGDQILPSISPNISIWPTEPEGDPLALFLASLERFKGLPEDTLVLPSHGLPFRGLEERRTELLHHHDQRLDQTLAHCAEPQTAIALVKVLFERRLDSHQLFFAVGETLAHLHYLMGRALIVRETGADGVHRYRRAP